MEVVQFPLPRNPLLAVPFTVFRHPRSAQTCTGELRRKMACEKCIRQDPFSRVRIRLIRRSRIHRRHSRSGGAFCTRPLVVWFATTNSCKQGCPPQPSLFAGWAGGKRKCDGADKLRSVGYMFILTCSHVLHNMHRRTTPQNGMREVHTAGSFFKGANPTHPSVANPSPTQPERGRILHPPGAPTPHKATALRRRC